MDVDGITGGETYVPWQVLKDWIAKKEAYEKEHHRPAPMSPLELQAVQLLIPPPMVELEPDIGNKNWIGLLQRYVDAHRKTTGAVYSDEERHFTSLNGLPALRWISYCKIGESSEKFPNPSYGMERGARNPPSFMRKKNARQYAAKNAIDFLMANDFMPKDGENVLFPKGSKSALSSPTPPSLRSRGASPITAPADVSQPHTTTKMDIDTARNKPQGARGVLMSQQVNQLCLQLGINPPRYALQPQPDEDDMWNGRAQFDDRIVPQDVGVVNGVYTERFARERVAEQVLKWLLSEERRRKDIKEDFLA